MAKILRGDILWADLEPTQGHEQKGRRPVLVLSHEPFNTHSNTVIAVALTSQPQRAPYPLSYPLEYPDLPKKTWVKISQIRILSVARLGKVIGRVRSEDLAEIIAGLNQIIA